MSTGQIVRRHVLATGCFINPVMFARGVGAKEELYYADRNTNRVTALSGIFSPSSSNKNDANGNPVTPTLEYRMFGPGPGLKAFGFGRLTYDLRDNGDSPSLAVQVASGVEATTYATVETLTSTADASRHRFDVCRDAQGVNVRLVQTNASSKTELYALEVESRGYPQAIDGP